MESKSSPQNPTAVKSKWRDAREVWNFIKSLIIIVILALILRAGVIEPYQIPSGSMIPTLLIGDHIFVTKFNYGIWLPFFKTTLWNFAAPKRGEIVVFTRPDIPYTTAVESKDNIIKRVVGLPGEKIEVRGTQVLINDQPLDEPYAVWDEGGIKNFGPDTVPPGHVFLMGDNRDHSKDSRFWEDGYHFLDIRRIKGRALIIYWNLQELSRMGQRIR